MDPSYTGGNRLKPGQNNRPFTDDIFNFILIFSNYIYQKITTDTKQSLVQTMFGTMVLSEPSMA